MTNDMQGNAFYTHDFLQLKKKLVALLGPGFAKYVRHTPNAGKILAWRVEIETHMPDLADKKMTANWTPWYHLTLVIWANS